MRRIAELLSSPQTKLFASFVGFALKPLSSFNVAFQTSSTKIGTMQEDVLKLLRSYLANFVKPEVLAGANDALSVNFADQENQVSSLLYLFSFYPGVSKYIHVLFLTIVSFEILSYIRVCWFCGLTLGFFVSLYIH